MGDFPGLKVWLFGSRAKGTHKNNSDIDLAISSRSKRARQALVQVKTDLEDSDLPYTVDVVWWDDMLKSFLPEVKKTRIPFWDPSKIVRRSPWRICPIGEHWVRQHPRERIKGPVEDVDGHCRKSPGHRDIIFFDELSQIEKNILFNQATRPALFKSKPGWGKEYDGLVAGWTAYWNDILELSPRLDPSWVKLLIASESSFDPNASPDPSSNKSARGLIQIMPQTRKILSDYKGELKDHFVSVHSDNLFNPSVSIATGIRWLARKKDTASRKLKREATWQEAILEYKGVLKQDPKRGKNPAIRKKLKEFADDLGLVF